MASTARPTIRTIRTSRPSAKPSRDQALRKLARIIEDQMTDLGLNEDEKNAKTAELAAFVSDAVAARLAPHAKHAKRPRNAALQD
jgi:hypothetical protein